MSIFNSHKSEHGSSNSVLIQPSSSTVQPSEQSQSVYIYRTSRIPTDITSRKSVRLCQRPEVTLFIDTLTRHELAGWLIDVGYKRSVSPYERAINKNCYNWYNLSKPPFPVTYIFYLYIIDV